MDLESIYALMERFERSTLTGLELEQNGTRLKLDRTVTAAPAAAAPSPAAVPVPSAAPAAQPPQESGAEYIKAPLVGTFYAASGPDSAPFVQAGDRVKKGQTVCILEAMKMEIEVSAPVDGTVKSVAVNVGATVNTDDLLVTIG